jgi:hypothetical protein
VGVWPDLNTAGVAVHWLPRRLWAEGNLAYCAARRAGDSVDFFINLAGQILQGDVGLKLLEHFVFGQR